MARTGIARGGRSAAIIALASGAGVPETARLVSRSVRTVFRWSADPAFSAEVDAVRAQLAKAALGRLANAAPATVDRLIALAEQNENLPVAVSAARALLENFVRLREQLELAGRLDALETVVTVRLSTISSGMSGALPWSSDPAETDLDQLVEAGS